MFYRPDITVKRLAKFRKKQSGVRTEISVDARKLKLKTCLRKIAYIVLFHDRTLYIYIYIYIYIIYIYNFIAPSYGWGSTSSRLQGHYVDKKFPEILGTHYLGWMKG